LRLTLSDPKTKKSYNAEADEKTKLHLLGKKINDEVDLSGIAPGLKGKITGGSDKQGFPMHTKLDSESSKKILTTKGIGFRTNRNGERRRVRVAGRVVVAGTAQVNIKITEGDTTGFFERFPKQKKEEESGAKKKKTKVK
jgi:small subunit ribosomal protein S6e